MDNTTRKKDLAYLLMLVVKQDVTLCRDKIGRVAEAGRARKTREIQVHPMSPKDIEADWKQD